LPTAYHDDPLIDALAGALLDVRGRLAFPLRHHAFAAEWLRVNSRETSMRRASLGRQVCRNLFTQQASIFAVRPIARTGCCQLPQPLILAIIGSRAGSSPFGTHFRKRDRVLCLRRLAHQGSAGQALNLGLLFFANVPYAIDLCAMVWFSSRDYGRGVNRPTYRAAIEEFQR
jgi:hypothetical protein